MENEYENTGLERCQEIFQQNPRSVKALSLECCFSALLWESSAVPGQDRTQTTKDKQNANFKSGGSYWFYKSFVKIFIPTLKSLCISSKMNLVLTKMVII